MTLTNVLLSAISVYPLRGKIPIIGQFLVSSPYGNESIKGTDSDEYWAKKILDGGFILHFRHAEREKWIDIEAYDSLESEILQAGSPKLTARDTYFSKAVCLNSRGLVQVQMMREHLEKIELPTGWIVTSTSCRARETALGVFGRYDDETKLLVHNGPYWEMKENRVRALKDFYIKLPIKPSTNTVVSAHNSVIIKEIFETQPDEEITLEEGGFYVIAQTETGGLKLMHRFYDFSSFVRVFQTR